MLCVALRLSLLSQAARSVEAGGCRKGEASSLARLKPRNAANTTVLEARTEMQGKPRERRV